MSKLFKNKYRIESVRWQKWNYASEAMYFVTICTKKRKNYFGSIPDLPGTTDLKCVQDIPKIHPTEIGKIAQFEWYKTPEIRLDMNLQLGAFAVMPNHLHGIIMIGANEFNTMESITHGGYLSGPQSKNLASIIRGYKSAVTTYARKNAIEFDWQASYHDHVIRSANEYVRISNYITRNPL